MTATALNSATKTQMQSVPSTSDCYTSPLRQQFHPGHPKAWVRCNTSGSITAQYNVTSVTDTGVGIITVVVTTAFVDVAYDFVVSASGGSTAARIGMPYAITNTSTFVCECTDGAGTLADPSALGEWMVAAYGTSS